MQALDKAARDAEEPLIWLQRMGAGAGGLAGREAVEQLLHLSCSNQSL